MRNPPLVSVVVPAHNSAKYISEALKSALSQDYPNLEVIVVNDGSTDDTEKVLDSFGDQITVLTQENSGPGAARNQGLRIAKGKYIALLDSDDLWLTGKLRRQVAHLESHPEVGLVYTAWKEWRSNESGKFEIPSEPEPHDQHEQIVPDLSGWLYRQLFVDCVVHTTTVLMRRDVVDQVGEFDTELRRGQDYDYWFRVSQVTPMHKLKATLSLYRIHSESITRRPHRTNYGYLVIKKALDRWGRRGPDGTLVPKAVINQRLALLWFRFGYTHYRSGDIAIAKAAFMECIRYRPFWYSPWLNLSRSVLKSLSRPDR